MERTALTYTGNDRKLFNQADWHRVLSLAAFGAGHWWIANYLPLRWDIGYARGVLKYMKGGRRPFYQSGEWVEQAAMSRPHVTARGGTVHLAVRVPVGHAVKAHVSEAFRQTPAREIAGVHRAFGEAIEKIISGSDLTARGGKGKLSIGMRLSAKQRESASSIRGRKGVQTARDRRDGVRTILQARLTDQRNRMAASAARAQMLGLPARTGKWQTKLYGNESVNKTDQRASR